VKIRSNIPNAFTLLNLLSGVLGIIWVLQGNILAGAYFILISAIFDFIDGFAARLLKVSSAIGKELDSLADLVSFGVLPGFILFKMAAIQSNEEWLPYFTLIVPLLSAYRLAKFNLDTRQSDQFIGLPTPANALFISTLPYLAISAPQIGIWLSLPWTLVIIAWVMSILLISEIPLIALKFKNYTFKDNVFRYALLGIGALLISFFGLSGIPWVILAYIVLSLLENGRRRQ
jgi:CDP-diacylglycerol---serine O-phosphatidyltransferase